MLRAQPDCTQERLGVLGAPGQHSPSPNKVTSCPHSLEGGAGTRAGPRMRGRDPAQGRCTVLNTQCADPI